MDLKLIGTELFIKYVLPCVKTIAKSLISTIGKSIYEKLYTKFVKALKSFEDALKKCFSTSDAKKLEKRLRCCKLGFVYFERIKLTLEKALNDYAAAIQEAETRYNELTGETIDIALEGENNNEILA